MNRSSPYFFANAVWASASCGFRIVSDTLVIRQMQMLVCALSYISFSRVNEHMYPTNPNSDGRNHILTLTLALLQQLIYISDTQIPLSFTGAKFRLGLDIVLVTIRASVRFTGSARIFGHCET